MKKLIQLRQARAKIVDRNKALLAIIAEDQEDVEKRSEKLTNEQINAEYEANEKQLAELDTQIKAAEDEDAKWKQRHAVNTEALKHIGQSAGLPLPIHGGQQTGNEDRRAPAIHVKQRHYGSLRNIHGERHGMSAEERAFRIGMWGLALASITLPHRYRFKQALAFAQQQLLIVHGEGAGDTTGAHLLVPDEFSADLIDLKENRGIVRRLFGREPMMSDTKTVPRRKSGLTAYAVGENAAGSESDVKLDDIGLVAKKWMVLTRLSKELNEDSAINFGDMLLGEIAYAFASAEDTAGFNGDASSTYHGIRGVRNRLQDVDGAGTDSFGLATASGNAWSEITLADFNSVLAKLPDYADNDQTCWVTHRAFYYGVMQKLELAAGGTTALEIREGNRKPRPMFLGFPVEFSQVFPSSEANSSVVCTLGDHQTGAIFGDRRSEEIEFDDKVTVGGQSVWERDQIAAKGTERFDINVHGVGTSTAAGPICGLQTAGS